MQPTPIALDSTQVLRAVREFDGVNLPLSTLAYWSLNGIAPASVRHTGGYGPKEKRLYSLMDLARVRLLVQLRELGVSGPRLRVVIAAIERELPELLQRRGTRAVLRVDGWRGVIVERPGRAAQRLDDGQLLLPLADVQVNERDVRRILAA